MVGGKRRLLLAAMILVVGVLAMTGSVARPVTVHSEGNRIETYCRCVWDASRLLFCYHCCNYSGCFDLYCDPGGC